MFLPCSEEAYSVRVAGYHFEVSGQVLRASKVKNGGGGVLFEYFFLRMYFHKKQIR
jgi:hypothetical protein